MSKSLITRVFYILFFTLFGIVLLSFGLWIFKPKEKFRVFILDKTVPTQERYNHRALHWVLKHEKYAKSDHNLYNLNKDYFGFYPLNLEGKKFDFKSLAIQDIEIVSDTSDIVYYADTYGVYYNDWNKTNLKVDPEQKVYGGLNQNDYLLLKEMKEKNKTIITEFVLLNTPTSDLVRMKTEELLGIKSEGWVGKYFNNLDISKNPSVPQWVVDLYMSQNQNKWPYKNSGVVLVHKYGKVVVLEEGKYLKNSLPYIKTDKSIARKYELPDSITYPYWFDIVLTNQNNEVFSTFNLKTTQKGDSVLKANRLSKHFPAIIKHDGDYVFYYFAGDFADNTIRNWSAYFAGIEYVSCLLYSDKVWDRRKFFWDFYNPLMRNILKESASESD